MAQSKMSEVLQRRELTGKALVTLSLLGSVGALGVYYFSRILPWLIDLTQNMLTLGVTCAAIAVLGYVFFNPKTRMLASYGYASFVRFITMRFTELDPIGILNTYVSRLRERLESMDEAIGSLNGHVKQLAEVIEQNEQKRKNAMARAEQAHKIAEKGGEQADVMRAEMAAASHAAGRLADSNKRLTKSLTQGEGLLRNLRKLRGAVDVSIKDIAQNVEVMTTENRMMKQGFKAFKQARGALGADDNEREMYEMTLDRLSTDYNEKMGQIDEFMNASQSLINGAELDNMVYEDDALKQIAAKNAGSPVEAVPQTKMRVGGDDDDDPPPNSFGNLYQKRP
jgi:hypothetical protein